MNLPDDATLKRIAAALERLAPPPPAEPAPGSLAAMRWDGRRLDAVAPAPTVPIHAFIGVGPQIERISCNLESLAQGGAAHDMLLWGARGMGKSALVRALAGEKGIALVECAADDLASLPRLFGRLMGARGPFLIFVDDLAFDGPNPLLRTLRSLLDGGVARRPDHCRLAVTSNHRHLIADAEASDSRHPRDSRDDALALVDRFGLVLGFHPASQEEYLAMCRTYLEMEGLGLDETDALAFALARGGRSGRTAWHYRVECLTRRAGTAPTAPLATDNESQ